MSDTATQQTNLDALRQEIDEIDEEMHELLIRRGEIIDRLLTSKNSRTGGAFRPDREADMMRRIVERHRGHLPLTTVEHLWREIISTFTQLQSSYTVHLDAGDEPLAMADMARFYFGFATPVKAAEGPEAAIAAVAGSRGDLALVRLADLGRAWWRGLGADAQIMARLPYIRLKGREASTPAFVVSRPLDAVRAYDVILLSVEGAVDTVAQAVDQAGGEIAFSADEGGTSCHLVAVHTSQMPVLRNALDAADASAEPVGGYFSPIEAEPRGA